MKLRRIGGGNLRAEIDNAVPKWNKVSAGLPCTT